MNKILIVVIVSLVLFFIFSAVPKYDVLEMDLEVGNMVGFNLDKDAVHFGTGYKGSTAKRHITITPNFKSRVLIKSEGDLSTWIYVSDNNFLLEAGESKKVYLYAEIPSNASYGMYRGKLKILTYRLIF